MTSPNLTVKTKIFSSNLMNKVASSTVLEDSSSDGRQKHKHCYCYSNILYLKHNSRINKQNLQSGLLQNKYKSDSIDIKYNHYTDECYSIWTSQVVLNGYINGFSQNFQIVGLSRNTYHMSGNDDLRSVIRKTNTLQSAYIVKSDIKKFYDSVNQNVLINECKKNIKDNRIINTIKQYANCLEDALVEYQIITQEILKDWQLSRLVILKLLNNHVSSYIRYMNDWFIFTKTKTQLRNSVKSMNEIIKNFKFTPVSDKTLISKTTQRFDFLSYRFEGQQLTKLARRTVENFINKILSFMSKMYLNSASVYILIIGEGRLKLESWNLHKIPDISTVFILFYSTVSSGTLLSICQNITFFNSK